MPSPPQAEETSQLEALIQAVEDLRRRVAALEAGAPSLPPAMVPATVAPAAEIPDVSSGLLAALGRLLLGIAGAYLLRAITEANVVPPLTGTLAGLAYAGAWLISTARITTGHRLSVAIHGVAAACITAPLLWEATARFHSLTPAQSALALAVFAILGQIFAWQRDHAALAAVTAAAGSATAIALIIGTLDPAPFAIALLATAAVVEFGAGRGRALAWRWIIALAVDFCAFLLVYLVTRPQGVPEGYASIPVPVVGVALMATAAIYAVSIGLRTLAGGFRMTWFELAQVVAAAALAIGGGLRISQGGAAVYIGAACLLVGAACYAAALTDLAAKPARNFYVYSTLALALAIGGCAMVFSGMAMALICSALALAAIGLAARRGGNAPSMHGAAYLIAAAVASGLLDYTVGTMTGFGAHVSRISAEAVFCAVAVALGFALVLWKRRKTALEWFDRLPAAMIAALMCWSWAAIAVGVLLRAGVDAPLAGTLRTAVVGGVALALAWFGRRRNLSELIWILVPWMLFGAAKLVAEDFRRGRSATLFLSLLLYGATLIALPRLLRRGETPR